MYIMGVDDNNILDTPYGSMVGMTTVSSREDYNQRNTTVTLLVSDNDEGG